MFALVRVSVPAPVLVSPAVPLITPLALVFEPPPIVKRNPPLAMAPPKTRLPAFALHVCATPSVMALLIVWVFALLLVTPAAVLIV